MATIECTRQEFDEAFVRFHKEIGIYIKQPRINWKFVKRTCASLSWNAERD